MNHLNLVILIILVFPSIGLCQSSKWDIQFYAGIQYNFFVDYGESIVRTSNNIEPIQNSSIGYLQKNQFGSVFGGSIFLNLKSENSIGLDYQRSVNTGSYNDELPLGNSDIDNIFIRNMKLFHINNSVSVLFRKKIWRNRLTFSTGMGIMLSDQQEVSYYNSFLDIETRKWEEFIVPLNLSYESQGDNITFGFDIRSMFTPFLGGFENVGLTPFVRIPLF